MIFRGAFGPVPLSTAQYLEWFSFSPTLFQQPKCPQARCILLTSSQRLGAISCCQLTLIYHKVWFPPSLLGTSPPAFFIPLLNIALGAGQRH